MSRRNDPLPIQAGAGLWNEAMPTGDMLTDDDPEMGQAPGAGAPVQQPQPPQGQPGNLAAFARSKMGPQVSAPGPGNQADAAVLVQQAIETLKQAGMGLPPGSKLHGDIYKAVSTLSRHLGGPAAMGPAAGVQKTNLGDQLKHTVQNALLSHIIGQKQPGGQPPPPMPSTPLPGA